MMRMAILPSDSSLDAIRTGFGVAAKVLEEGKGSILLVIPNLEYLKSGDLRQYLRKYQVAALSAGNTISIDNEVKLQLATDRTLEKVRSSADAILGVHVDFKTLEKASRINQYAKALVYVPWMDSQANEFLAAYEVTVIAPVKAHE